MELVKLLVVGGQKTGNDIIHEAISTNSKRGYRQKRNVCQCLRSCDLKRFGVSTFALLTFERKGQSSARRNEINAVSTQPIIMLI